MKENSIMTSQQTTKPSLWPPGLPNHPTAMMWAQQTFYSSQILILKMFKLSNCWLLDRVSDRDHSCWLPRIFCNVGIVFTVVYKFSRRLIWWIITISSGSIHTYIGSISRKRGVWQCFVNQSSLCISLLTKYCQQILKELTITSVTHSLQVEDRAVGCLPTTIKMGIAICSK